MQILKMLLLAERRRKKGRLAALLLILLTAFACLEASLTLRICGEDYAAERLQALGYGDLTVWVAKAPENLAASCEIPESVDCVTAQPLIYADYRIGDHYSDNEGQLIPLDPELPYRIVNERGEEERDSVLLPGEIYLSPALAASFAAAIGDSISFEYSRAEKPKEFVIKGFFEDPFMGSSMIDMKSFLIDPSDYEKLREQVGTAKEADRIAEAGAMLHVFGRDGIPAETLMKDLAAQTDISLYTRYSYTAQTILRYQLLLQNILCGFLLAVSFLCFGIAWITAAGSISAELEEEAADLAALKMLGASGNLLRNSLFLLYGEILAAALLFAQPVTLAAVRAMSVGLVSSVGMRMAVKFPLRLLLAAAGLTAVLFTFFLLRKTAPLKKQKPILYAAGEESGAAGQRGEPGKPLVWTLALRNVLSAKGRYMGLFLTALLLTVFLSVIGRMSDWVGSKGEGLMNAFSAADHDLGVQPFHVDVPMDEIERAINWYSPVTESYELAMQSVFVNGVRLTGNVLSDPSYFHLLRGKVCGGDEVLITETVADDLGLAIGDVVEVTGEGRTEAYTVSGIYMCANGMGDNIGMSLSGYSKIGNTNAAIWCHHYILKDGSVRDYAAEFLQKNYRGIDVHTNSWSGLEGIVALLHRSIGAAYALAVLLIGICVALSAGAVLRPEKESIAICRCLGMSLRDLRLSLALRFGLVSFIGSLAGLVLSLLFAGPFVKRIFRQIGIGPVTIRASSLSCLFPVLLIPAAFFLFACLAGRRIGQTPIVDCLSEKET